MFHLWVCTVYVVSHSQLTEGLLPNVTCPLAVKVCPAIVQNGDMSWGAGPWLRRSHVGHSAAAILESSYLCGHISSDRFA